MNASGKKWHLVFNAPAILGFVGVCVVVQLVSLLTKGRSNELLFCVYRSSLLDPLTYLRMFTHVLGHANWSHLLNNMMYILILGPMLEEKYGSVRMLFVMLCTALITGLVNFFFFPHYMTLGASGIVFALILLSSITTTEEGSIPVSFILVALLYIGQQVVQGISQKDNISQISHIAGGAVGSVLGFLMNRQNRIRE